MDKLCLLVVCVTIVLLLSDPSFGRRHVRTRARHILVRYPHERTSSRPLLTTGSADLRVTFTTTRRPDSAEPSARITVRPLSTTSQNPRSFMTTQSLHPQEVTTVSSPNPSPAGQDEQNSPLSTTTSTTTEQQPRRQEEPLTRRGSQAPEQSYSGSDWDLIQQRIAIAHRHRPTSTTTHSSRYTIPIRRGGRDHQNLNGQTTPTPDPFIPKMSALDYLSRRANNDILHSRNNQRNRETSRMMGEVMCESFGKHYVSISIGGKCV